MNGRTRTLAALALALSVLPEAGGAQRLPVSGAARWVDVGDSMHPVRRARVEVMDADRHVLLDTTRTGETGEYAVQLDTAGVRAVYVQVVSRTLHAEVVEPTIKLTYAVRTPDRPLPADGGPLVMDDIVGTRDSASNVALAIADALEHGADFRFRRAGAPPPPVTAAFPAEASIAVFDGKLLHVPRQSAWDWDVVLHEYGHFVARLDALSGAPQGEHYLDRRIEGGKDFAVRLAWAEGWATYFSIAAQRNAGLSRLQIPWVGDTRYTAWGMQPVDLNRPEPSWSFGERSEVSVMRVLYNVADDDPGAPADAEQAAVGDQRVWDLLRAGQPEQLSDAWRLLARGLSADETGKAGRVLESHQVAPALRTPNAGAPLSTSAPLFKWYGRDNTRFSLVIRDAAGAVLYRRNGLERTAHQPPDTTWARVRAQAAGRPVFWEVEGTDTTAPATGPYLSSRRRLGR